MPKNRLSVTVDADLIAAIDTIAEQANENRSECVERLLAQSIGDDDSGLVEFLKIRGPLNQVRDWMRHEDFFNEADKVEAEDGPVELVFRVTQKQWDGYMAKHGVKGRKKGKGK